MDNRLQTATCRFRKGGPDKPRQLIPTPFDGLALFSGGLDSLIGAIDSLEPGRSPTTLHQPCCRRGHERFSRQAFRGIEENYPKQISPLENLDGFSRRGCAGGRIRENDSGTIFPLFCDRCLCGNRSCSFVLFRVPENGLIALMFRSIPSRLGALYPHDTSFLYCELERSSGRPRYSRPH